MAKNGRKEIFSSRILLKRSLSALNCLLLFQVTVSLHVLQAEKEQKLVVKDQKAAAAATTSPHHQLLTLAFVILWGAGR